MSKFVEATTQFSFRNISLKWHLDKWKHSPEYSQYMSDLASRKKEIMSPRFDTKNAGMWQIGFEFSKDDTPPRMDFFQCNLYKVKSPGIPACAFVKGSVRLHSLIYSNGRRARRWTREETVEVAVRDGLLGVACYKELVMALPESLEIVIELDVGGWSGKSSDKCAPNYFHELSISQTEHPLQLEMRRVLEDEEFADLTVTIEERKMKAHRAILAARSPVLRAMLTCDMKERSEATIAIKDTSAASWSIFQEFLYTEELDVEEDCDLEVLLDLMSLSDKYNVPSLMRPLEATVVKKMKLDNVLEIYEVAKMHRAKRIKAAAVDLIVQNWRSMRRENIDTVMAIPELASELLKQL